MVYDVETVLVDVLEQDRQACYDAVRIAGSVLNTKSWYGVLPGITVTANFSKENIHVMFFGTVEVRTCFAGSMLI